MEGDPRHGGASLVEADRLSEVHLGILGLVTEPPSVLGTLGQLVILSWTNSENLLPWLLGPLSSLSFPQEK